MTSLQTMNRPSGQTKHKIEARQGYTVLSFNEGNLH